MSIKQQTIRGAVWISISNLARQLIFFLLSAILYRLLVPADFGTIAMATVLITAMGIRHGDLSEHGDRHCADPAP